MKQNQMRRGIWAGLPATAIIGLLLAALVPNSHAVERTWNGAGDGTTMSSGANWVGGVAPVAGTDALVFDGTTGTNIFNDYPGGNGSPAFAGITFATNAGPFTIANNPISISAGTGITNYSTNLQYFTAAIEHNGAPHVYNTINGPMKFDAVNGRANGNVVIKAGTNDMFLASATDNNGTVFVVSNGVVICNKTGPTTSRAIGGTAPTTIWTNGTVRIANGSSLDQIFARVKLNMLGGTFQLQNTNEGISNLAGWTNSVAGIVENGLAGTTNTLRLGDENNHRAIYFGTIRDGAAGVLNLAVARNTVQQFHGTHTYSGTTTISNVTVAGTTRMIMNGTHVGGGAYVVSGHPTTVDQLATLNGSGIISASSMDFGIRGVLSPGGNWSLDGDGGAYSETAAILTVSNAPVNLNDVTSTLELQLNGTTAGSLYDQVAIEGSGTFSNNNANLKLTIGYAAAVGDKFTIVKVPGTNSANNVGIFSTLNGLVQDLAQGVVFVESGSGKSLRISYRADGSTFDAGAGGNDIMLEVVEPLGGQKLTWRGDVNNLWDITTTANWRNTNNIASTFTNTDFVTFNNSGSNGSPIDITTSVWAAGFLFDTTNDYVLAGAGKLTGSMVLTKTNIGTLSIVTDNDNTGAAIIYQGVLQVGTNGTTGTLSGNVNVKTNGVLALNRSDDIVISTATFTGAGSFVHNGSGQLTITADMTTAFTGNTTNTGGLLQFGDGVGNVGQIGGTVHVPATNTVSYNYGGSANINNALGGSGTVNYASATGGTLNLATTAISSNFTGVANLLAGVRVHAQNGSSFPFGNGSTVNVPSGSQAWCDTATYNNTFNIAGDGWIGTTPATGAISVFGCTFTGLINLLADARISGTISGGTILCPITGPYRLEVWGNLGSYVLSIGPTNGVHTYASTLITSGTLRALNTNAISTGPLTMDVAADLRLNGNNLTVSNLSSITSGNVTGTGATIQNIHGSTPATLTVGKDDSSTAFDGFFFNGGSAALGLTKVGTGTFTVSGINSNTGPVTVNGGTLALSGSGSFGFASQLIANATLDVTGAGGTLTLNSGQKLGGSGNVTGEVIASVGSTVSPGTSVGTLTVSGNVTLGGLLHMELNRTNTPSNCDQLVSGGTITYGGSLLVTNIGPVLQVNDTFQLFPSGVAGFGGNITLANTDASGMTYTWQTNIATLGSVKVLSVVAPVNPNPTNIVASASGGNLNLSWPTDHIGWSLQAQTNSRSTGLGTNWTTLGYENTNAVSIPINPADPTVFFRLFYIVP